MGRMFERGPNNRQSLPWSFLFFRSPQRCAQRCLCADRSRFLDPTGNGACQMKKRMHSTSATCVTVCEYHDLANPMVIQHLGEKSIQTHRDIADVLRHIIKNVSERLFRNIQSGDPVTQWDFFCFFEPQKGRR
jgi:hypothetical protein